MTAFIVTGAAIAAMAITVIFLGISFVLCLRRRVNSLCLSHFFSHGMTRGVPYFLSLIFVAILFFGIEFGIEKFFYQNDEIVDIFAASFGALAFWPLRHFFDKATDHLFFRNSYHFLTVVKDLGERMGTSPTRNALIVTIVDFLHLTIRPTEAVFFEVNNGGGGVALISGLAAQSVAAADYSSLAMLLLKRSHSGVVVADLMRLFRISRASDKEHGDELIKETAARLGIAAIIPVVVHGKMKMIIMVGHKCSGALLNKDDGEFLGFMARRTSIALENFELRELMERQAERFEERVVARTERLKSMYESQSRFLADVSHEFKTPLAILKMHASVFAASKDIEQKRAWYVMDATLDRLSRMVSDLLDVTKAGSSREARRKNVFLEDLLRETRDDCAILAEDKGVHFYCSSEKISILGEWDKLKEVILNLLSNALQHTPVGGSIFLVARVAEDEAEIMVRDTGSGISLENLPHIFERFYRIGESHFAGTGIGLYLCRQIIEGHGGTIVAESQPGRGSCFIVRLPILSRDT